MRSFTLRLMMTASLLAVVTGCEPTFDIRGNVPPPERLAQVQPGKLTKSDVAALIGTPSNTSTFGDDSWYYVSSKVKTWAFFSPEEVDRQVIEVDFDKLGVVSAVRKLGLQDGKVVDVVTRETPTAGRDMSIIEQLLGNVGKFSKAKEGGGGGGV
jgi:outer membrane protein assembly factor BamE (lipoprotein component of BamABCDE complex)